MNAKWLSIGLTCLALSAGAEQDLRKVNGVTVDLAPLNTWLAHPEGERPLKHWKQVTVQSVTPAFGHYFCMIEGDGVPGAIYLPRLPKDVLAHFQQVDRLQAEMTSLRQHLEALRSDINHAQAAVADYNSRNLFNPDAPYAFVKETAKLSLQESQARLEEVSKEWVTLSGIKFKILAMFTGRTLPFPKAPAKRAEVWDTGLL